MSIESPFDDIAVRSHADIVEEAVQVVLQANAELAELFGERIFIVVGPLSRPDGILPLLTIFTPAESRDFELQHEDLVKLPIGIGIWYDEPRLYREAGKNSVKTLVNLIVGVLRADQRLDTTAGLGPEPLAEAITGVDSLDFGRFFEKSDDGDVYCVGSYRQVLVDYQYAIESQTGVMA